MKLHNGRFDGDANSLEGFWSPPTSRANFCEEDYLVTSYVAEFINSLSSLAYVYLALRHMYGTGSSGLFRPNVDLLSLSFLLFGLSSVLFHAGLRETLESAEKFAILSFLWSMLRETLALRNSRAKTREYSDLVACFVLISSFYLRPENKIVHAGFSTFLFLPSILQLSLCYLSKDRYPFDKSQDTVIRSWRATSIYMLGLIFRNLDLDNCAELRELRRSFGQPWAWLFELHGWWHILSAISASEFIGVLRELRIEAERESQEEQPEDKNGGNNDTKDDATFLPGV